MIHDLTLETIRNMTTDLMIPDMIVNLFREPTLDLIKDLTPDLMIEMKPVHLFTHDLIPYLIPDPLRDGIKDLMVDPTPDRILGLIHQPSLDLTPSTLPDLLHDLLFMTFHFCCLICQHTRRLT